MSARPARPLTGRKVFAMFVAFFGVIIAVNLVMANFAVTTFGGVVVKNSYVASQNFNRWLDAADRQKALGWTVTVAREADGRIAVTLANVPAGAQISGEARHPLGRQPDRALTFRQAAPGRFVSNETLGEGRWTVRTQIVSGKDRYRAETAL